MFSLGTKIAYLVCRIFVKEEKNMSKKKWKIPSSYVIIMAIVVLVAILSWVLPAVLSLPLTTSGIPPGWERRRTR